VGTKVVKEIECKICGKEFKLYNQLSRHISKHNISKKEYYDKYFKSDGEGLCRECGKETKFENISFGYHEFCSLSCLNKSKVVDERRAKSKKNKNKRVKVKKIKCEICQEYVVSLKALSQHILNHNITSKEYYDKFLKTNEKEGFCLECNKPTKFKGLKSGYQKFCNLVCSNNNEERKKKFVLSYYGENYNPSEYERYNASVWRETNKSIKRFNKEIKNLEFRGQKFGNDLDHKFSIFHGFISGKVDPKIVGNWRNLEVIPSIENSRKQRRSSISLSQLLEDIKQ